jgi:uncharacterized protein (TIGR03437 family)
MKRIATLLLFAAAAAAQTPTVLSVVNIVNYQTALCPGLDVAIFGANFGNGPASSVSISVGGVPGYVFAVTPTQIDAELPVNVPAGPTTITVTVGGTSSAAFTINLAAYAPVFEIQTSGAGTGAGLFLSAANVAITPTARALPGYVIFAYLIGLGPTTPPTPTGASGVSYKTSTLPTLKVGNTDANILFSGSAEYAGLYQINFQVPGNASGIEPVTVTIGGVTSAIPVTLAIVGATAPAIGSVDLPVDNTTGVTGAISVTGWGLSWAGVQTIALWREPVKGETPTSNGLVFLGNTAIVPMSRPDVALAHPGYPQNNSGFGAQVLTNELPNNNGTAGIGNGTYTIHVLVTDTAGEVTDIGKTTFTADNAQGVLPFGTIDTPITGATVSGTIVNFGWVVTPNPANVVPKDGSTIWVFIDNVRVGHPVYNNYRADIATLFPGLQNSNGAVGYYYIDTTTLNNGLHTIAWVATDSAGNAQGLGSRYFLVQNNL